MIININRNSFHDYCTIGDFYIDSKLQCHTLEDTIRPVKIKGITAIPEGVYNLDLRQSPKFSSSFYWNDTTKKIIEAKTFKTLKDKTGWKQHDLIWVKDVPNYEFILIHWGNFSTDTEGCLIVGESKGEIDGKKAVLNSKSAYMKMYPIVYQAIVLANKNKCESEKVTIVYTNIKTKIV